jgi:hypothetical protein
MKRLALSIALVLAVLMTSFVGSTTPAEARSGRLVAGLAIGAIVGGIIASEAYRHKRQRTYYSYGYAPRYRYAPRSYYAPRYRYHY